MMKPGFSTLVALGTVVVVSGVVSVAEHLTAQVRKCYAETCTVIAGKTYCSEHEVPCPTQT